ncbi:hypothetical protein HK100_005924 [Physocladia obscura]|uniref:F-box domain-containing protein n=1 Tax=Physocladia obscura TaxID=109957 RepID=A0AAD5SWR3_9FUNG|nr:hypothetical protein HK100_005924 [Physocladia obscura]
MSISDGLSGILSIFSGFRKLTLKNVFKKPSITINDSSHKSNLSLLLKANSMSKKQTKKTREMELQSNSDFSQLQFQLPFEIIQSIFVYIDPKFVLKYQRLCKIIHSCLTDPFFARRNLDLHKFKFGPDRYSSMEPTEYDRCWFVWPEPYQKIYAEIALKPLVLIYWGDKNICGSIPHAIGILVNLKQLFLHRNHLTGGIPAEIGKLENLAMVNFRSNQLTGNVPIREFGKLRNLLYAFISKGNDGLFQTASATVAIDEGIKAVFRKDGILSDSLLAT